MKKNNGLNLALSLFIIGLISSILAIARINLLRMKIFDSYFTVLAIVSYALFGLIFLIIGLTFSIMSLYKKWRK